MQHRLSNHAIQEVKGDEGEPPPPLYKTFPKIVKIKNRKMVPGAKKTGIAPEKK